MISNGLMTYATNFNQQQKDRMMAVVPQVALAGADLYAGAATCLLPTATALKDALPIVAGAVALGHAAYGVKTLWPPGRYQPANTSLQVARGVGHVITAAGFGALALGLGSYALPVIVIGETARIAATFVGR